VKRLSQPATCAVVSAWPARDKLDGRPRDLQYRQLNVERVRVWSTSHQLFVSWTITDRHVGTWRAFSSERECCTVVKKWWRLCVGTEHYTVWWNERTDAVFHQWSVLRHIQQFQCRSVRVHPIFQTTMFQNDLMSWWREVKWTLVSSFLTCFQLVRAFLLFRPARARFQDIVGNHVNQRHWK